MDPISVLVGIVAASAGWGYVYVTRDRGAPRKPRMCIATWFDKYEWECTNVAHPSCRALRCRRHCKSDLCGCLAEAGPDPLETEVLKELRAVIKKESSNG